MKHLYLWLLFGTTTLFAQEYLNGVDVSVEYTSTYQGDSSDAQSYAYGGKFDSFINLDSNKLGLWKDGKVMSHIEYRHGSSNSFLGDTLLPVNSATILPISSPHTVVVSSLYLAQKLSVDSTFLIGKFNVVDFLKDDPFWGGWGNHRFMNVAFVAPPSGVLPPTIFGAILKHKFSNSDLTFMIYDPNDRTLEYLPNDLFADGFNISLALKSTFDKTTVSINGIYSTKEGTDLSTIMREDDNSLKTITKSGSYNLSLQVSHLLYNDTMKNFGIYGKINLSDGNPNIIRGSFIGGIAAKGMLFNRPNDSFGLGYFYYDWSEALKDSLTGVKNVDYESGIEMYYNYEATKWLHISADIQYIDGAFKDYDNALIFSLRTNIRF